MTDSEKDVYYLAYKQGFDSGYETAEGIYKEALKEAIKKVKALSELIEVRMKDNGEDRTS